MGAHYYAQSQVTTNYSVASCSIDLSKVSINNKKNGVVKRNGFLCLGMISDGTRAFQCDIGLGNTGNGWFPYSYMKERRPDTGTVTFGMNQILSNQNAIVDITYTVSKTSNQDKIVGVFKVGGSVKAQVTYTTEPGGLFKGQVGKPELRFERFMSLVPLNSTSDDVDNTTMEASITNLKLGNRTWESSLLEYVWSVQGANIESLKVSALAVSSVGTNADYIKINHRYQLH